MASTTPWGLACVALLLVAGPCAAQNAVTVYGGYQGGGALQRAIDPRTTVDLDAGGAAAISIDWAVHASRQLQLFASWQRTEIPATAASAAGPAQPALPLTLSYLHVGGTNFFDGPLGRGPYVVGGIGVTVMAPGLSGLSNEIRPSMNLGLGYQLPLAQNLSLRLEVRGLFTLVNSNTNLFCSGGCVVAIQGESFAQAQALAGLSFSF